MIKTILWKWPGEHATSGTFKKLQAKIALGKVVDNSITPTECTKARCFDTPNRNFFYRWGADEALTVLPRWGSAVISPARSGAEPRPQTHFRAYFPAKKRIWWQHATFAVLKRESSSFKKITTVRPKGGPRTRAPIKYATANSTMFVDLDWPLNMSRGFVSISWASYLYQLHKKEHQQTVRIFKAKSSIEVWLLLDDLRC